MQLQGGAVDRASYEIIDSSDTDGLGRHLEEIDAMHARMAEMQGLIVQQQAVMARLRTGGRPIARYGGSYWFGEHCVHLMPLLCNILGKRRSCRIFRQC